MEKTKRRFTSLVKKEEVSDQQNFSVGSGRFGVKTVANLFLIWLDEDIDKSSVFYNDLLCQLSQVADMLKVYINRDQCIDFLTDIQNKDICVIISEKLSQQVIPLIHDFDRLQFIFIYRRNQKKHEEWIQNWSKIKGIYTEISTICDTIMQMAKPCEQNAVSFNLLGTSDDLSNKKLNQLDPMFMYSQILTEIILDIQFDEEHFTTFIDYCREVSSNNDAVLKQIDEFQKNYHTKSTIEWYTSEHFLYTTLNRGLRIVDTDTIMKMGYYIANLYQQINQLHKEQYPEGKSVGTFIVYRGQVVPKVELEKIEKNKGGLIAFNSFLSTSRNPKVSSMFAENDPKDLDSVGILFIITVDPSKSTAAFASIQNFSQFQDEDEILFIVHAVFRIIDVKPMTNMSSRTFEVQLVLSDETDKDLVTLRKYVNEKIHSSYTGWDRFAIVLWQMGFSNKAQQIHEAQLAKITEENEKIPHYVQLGTTHVDQGHYAAAIEYYEKSHTILQTSLPSYHPDLASSYNNIGAVYSHMGDYSKALVSYEKALAIQQQSLPFNHPDLASSYNNIGAVYSDMGDYSKALVSYEKALAIQQQSLPFNHPDLAISYNNIGAVYSRMGDHSKALVSYEKALAIQQQSLPFNHPDLASSYNNIGGVYSDMGDYSKALVSYEKALAIRQQSLPFNHPDLASSYNNIGGVYFRMGDYSKALVSYEKALAIRQQSLPFNHPDLAISYNNIGAVYSRMGDHSKALVSYEKALAIQQQSLPFNHPDLAISYNNIGAVYSDMGDYSKALVSYEKALAIRQQSLPFNHPDLASSYNNIGGVYFRMGDYSKALVSYEKALAIRQQSLPFNHPDLASSYNNIGAVYFRMGDFLKARSFFERAMEIAMCSLPSNHPTLQNLQKILELLN